MELPKTMILGIAQLDIDHEVLLNQINSFYNINDVDDATIEFKLDQLKVLYDSCSCHFVTEEIMMKKAKYPYVFVHKTEHDKQLIKLKEFIFLFLDTELINKKTFCEVIQSMLYDWIIPHITDYDKLFADFYKNINSMRIPNEYQRKDLERKV